jgi:hypothetical protein
VSRDRLIVIAGVRPEDIDVVHSGLSADVNLLPHNQRRLPRLHGTVTHVSVAQRTFRSVATNPGGRSVVPGSLQILRYAVSAAESAGPKTTNPASFFTKYRNGLSLASSSDVFLVVTRPQMVSTDCPTIFFRMARFISMNSADAGSSSFAAIVVLALTMTGSDVSAGLPDAGASIFASVTVDVGFFSAGWSLSRTAAVDRSSVFAAVADLALVAAELVLDEAGAGSIDRLPVILSRPPKPFGSAHASMLACGDKG